MGWEKIMTFRRNNITATRLAPGLPIFPRRKSRGHSIRLSVVPWFCPHHPPSPLTVGLTVGTLCAQLLLQFYASFWNFAGAFVMVWRCACGLDIIHRLFFVTFSAIWTIFQAWTLSKGIDSGYLVCATPSTVLCRSFWNFTGVFVMVWRCAYELDIILRLNFVTFFAFGT